MTVRIQRMDTTVEIAPPNGAARREPAQTPVRSDDASSSDEFRQAVMKVLAEELGQFSRMRGH